MTDEQKEQMEKTNENRFGHFRNKTIEELKKIKNQLLDDNEYMATHAANSFQETDFHNDTKFNNEQIDFINKILDERQGRSR